MPLYDRTTKNPRPKPGVDESRMIPDLHDCTLRERLRWRCTVIGSSHHFLYSVPRRVAVVKLGRAEGSRTPIR